MRCARAAAARLRQGLVDESDSDGRIVPLRSVLNDGFKEGFLCIYRCGEPGIASPATRPSWLCGMGNLSGQARLKAWSLDSLRRRYRHRPKGRAVLGEIR